MVNSIRITILGRTDEIYILKMKAFDLFQTEHTTLDIPPLHQDSFYLLPQLTTFFSI